MQPVKKLLNKLNGYAYRQEYLCLAEPLIDPLYAYTVSGNEVLADITENHLFVGYSPVIFALENTLQEAIEIRFTHLEFNPGEQLSLTDSLAWLRLRPIYQSPGISYYEGTEAHHRFVPYFNQFMNGINNRLYQQKAGNVYLDNKLYPQVQIAYAIPREICLITVEQHGSFNLFPTDLHGAINRTQYIISLRQGGLACLQVQQAGKIVVSKMQPAMYKEVYKLGKNHMQPAKPKKAFPFSHQLSKELALPIPQNSVGYTELELQSAFDHGIHRLLLFNIIHRQAEPGAPSLFHIHNSYATWRFKHAFPGNYLLR
jgi:flavin reductase (DIM6/NTAB) family NADH-FMN oxidoreductase RutF